MELLNIEPDPFMDLSKAHVTRVNIQEIIGMKPKNIELYQRALVHKSVQAHVKHNLALGFIVQDYMNESFERLEFLGDAVFGLVIAEYLYSTYSDKDEGFLTRLRTKIVRGKNCSCLAKALGLGSFILTSPKILKIKDPETGIINNDKILEDAFESLIGAIYLDLGFLFAKSFILKLLQQHIDISQLLAVDDNYKDLLMRFTQINNFELPIYNTIESTGPAHNRQFRVTVSLKRLGSETQTVYGIGMATTKKEAEQNACRDSICNNNKRECEINHKNEPKIHINEIENLKRDYP